MLVVGLILAVLAFSFMKLGALLLLVRLLALGLKLCGVLLAAAVLWAGIRWVWRRFQRGLQRDPARPGVPE